MLKALKNLGLNGFGLHLGAILLLLITLIQRRRITIKPKNRKGVFDVSFEEIWENL